MSIVGKFKPDQFSGIILSLEEDYFNELISCLDEAIVSEDKEDVAEVILGLVDNHEPKNGKVPVPISTYMMELSRKQKLDMKSFYRVKNWYDLGSRNNVVFSKKKKAVEPERVEPVESEAVEETKEERVSSIPKPKKSRKSKAKVDESKETKTELDMELNNESETSEVSEEKPDAEESASEIVERVEEIPPEVKVEADKKAPESEVGDGPPSRIDGDKCVACQGTGKNTRGGECSPCMGTGLSKEAREQRVDEMDPEDRMDAINAILIKKAEARLEKDKEERKEILRQRQNAAEKAQKEAADRLKKRVVETPKPKKKSKPKSKPKKISKVPEREAVNILSVDRRNLEIFSREPATSPDLFLPFGDEFISKRLLDRSWKISHPHVNPFSRNKLMREALKFLVQGYRSYEDFLVFMDTASRNMTQQTVPPGRIWWMATYNEFLRFSLVKEYQQGDTTQFKLTLHWPDHPMIEFVTQEWRKANVKGAQDED